MSPPSPPTRSSRGETDLLVPVPLSILLRVWFGVGLQSFGGGNATMAIIQRTVTIEKQWMTEIEFARFWGLCQVAPGINLLALTLLIGRRMAGYAGALVSLFGLLLPSVAMTILMTAGYASVRHAPQMQAALRGLLPATIGLGLLASGQTLRPVLGAARRQGTLSLMVYILLTVLSGAAVSIGRIAVVYVLITSGLLCAGFHWLRAQSLLRQAAAEKTASENKSASETEEG